MSEDEAPSRPAWASWLTYGTLLFAIVGLAWTVYSVGFSSILIRLAGIGWWFVAVIVVEIASTLCDSAAIHRFLGPDMRKAGYPRVVMAQISGRAVNTVTPLGSLGEIVKMTMLMERVSQSRAVSTVLLYNLTTLELSLILVGLGATTSGALLALPTAMRTLLVVAGLVTAALAAALPVLVSRGMLASLVGFGRALHLITRKQAMKWRKQLEAIDEKLLDLRGSQRRDRVIAVSFVVLSRVFNWGGTAILIHAAGGSLSFGFLAAVLTAGQLITWLAAMVPLGLGITEGSNYALFSALGHEPGIGVTVSLGKRVAQIMYAALGIVLLFVNQTVKEAKRVHGRRAGKAAPGRGAPSTPPTPRDSMPPSTPAAAPDT